MLRLDGHQLVLLLLLLGFGVLALLLPVCPLRFAFGQRVLKRGYFGLAVLGRVAGGVQLGVGGQVEGGQLVL